MESLLEYSDQFNTPIYGVIIRLLAVFIGAWYFAPLLSKKLSGIENKISFNKWVYILAGIAWIIFFSAGMLRHLTFHSKAWDLAIFDQLIWNLANGNGWECSVRGVTDLRGDHFEPILYLFVPFYKILPHVGWLLGFQAASIIGAMLLIWKVARKTLGELSAFLMFIAFLCFPPVHWLISADFHPIAMAVFFAGLAWWGSKNDKWLFFAIGLIGMMSCGEEAFVVTGWWGLWELITRYPRKRGEKLEFVKQVKQIHVIGWIGLLFMFISWGGLLYVTMKYIPSFRTEDEGWFYVHRYAYLGESVKEIATSIITKPFLWIKHAFNARGIALLLLYFIPLAGLPLFRPKTLALVLPTAFYTLLSVSPEQRSIFHQYTAMWIPFLFFATSMTLNPMTIVLKNQGKSVIADAKKKVLPESHRASALVVASVLGMIAFSPLLGMSSHYEWFTDESWAGDARGLIQSIDDDQAVAANSSICPHLSHRRVILLLPDKEWHDTEDVMIIDQFTSGE